MTGQNPEDTHFNPYTFIAETAAGAVETMRLSALVDAAELILADAESRYSEAPQSFYAPDGYRFAFFPAETGMIPPNVLPEALAQYMELTASQPFENTLCT